MAFIGNACPNCGNTSYEQTLRWKGAHFLLTLCTFGIWGIFLILDAVWGYFFDCHLLPQLNQCTKCGRKYRRQHLSLNR